MHSKSLLQRGYAGMRRTLIRRRRSDRVAGRNTGFTISAMALAGILLVLSCGDGTTEPPAPDPLVPTAVAVSPAAATIVEGDTLRLTATATNVYGQVVTGAEFEWASGNTAVAVVDTAGLVTGVGTGEVSVTATAAGVTGRAELAVVAPLPTTIAVTPDTVVFTWVGHTTRLTAEVLDQGGRVMDGVAVTWSSADTTVAVVDSSGLVTAVGNGAVRVAATAGEVSGHALVTVAINLDRAALTALYNATDGPNWVDNTNWLTDAPLGEWYGVRTSATGRVTAIDLAGRWDNEARLGIPHGLTGPIPPELGDLSDLERLDLNRNDLSGAIPPELGNLANLRQLWLSVNDLSGAIPPELGNLANLQQLGLSVNNLSGAIPPELGNLANLQWLSLWTNALSGAIPPELGDLANLWTLGLSRNALSGAIPPELGSLANLGRLDLNDNELSGPIPPELGGLANLESLYLHYNDLSGPIPPELGGLANLEALSLYDNDLSGPIPRGFLQLDRLSQFYISENEGLCVPGTSDFLAWYRGIERRDDEPETLCNAADLAALESLYLATNGANWTNSDGWLGDAGAEEWHGVAADSLGRVTQLDLASNGLTGRFPESVVAFSMLRILRIGDNPLSGRLPLSLQQLPLRELGYASTRVCAPDIKSFQDWLGTLRLHEGSGVDCTPLTDREILELLYHSTGGVNWQDSKNWLTDIPLGNWYGVEVDSYGRVVQLNLGGFWLFDPFGLKGSIPPEIAELDKLETLNLGVNELSGPIPPEIGNLAELRRLSLYNNHLSGSIPPALGHLDNLEMLDLENNRFSGSIPSELGNLNHMLWLYLNGNQLSGAIPSELGNLEYLRYLYLNENQLSGPIPASLGNLTGLRALHLDFNQLSGSVPAGLGSMASLERLTLNGNAELAGRLPLELTQLGELDQLVAVDTGLCAPSDNAFQTWLDGVSKHRIATCSGAAPPAAYLVQAVQSREFPVPLVAGRRALLRVFPTAATPNSGSVPPVRARFHVGGREIHQVDVGGNNAPIPTSVDESALASSVNVEIPDEVIRPGLEMVIEVDPDNTLDPALGVAKRIPATGRLAVDVESMPPFDLTVIPFIWTETHDSSIVDLVDAMAADPENHEMLGYARTLLPIGELSVAAHAPVMSSSNSAFALLRETHAIRTMEGGTGHYKGMMSPPVTGAGGVAYLPGRSSFSQPFPGVIAHELGHNLNLRHAPCGGAGGPDPGYPYPDGSIGAWGYDFGSESPVHPSTSELMSYCGPSWISDYYFAGSLRFRLEDEGKAVSATAAASARSLLVWGGIGADSVPYLEPAFVVDVPAALPDSAGDYRITGRNSTGGELFSFRFAIPEVADGDGSSSFAFALPVRAGWEDSLATITLSGPGGTVTLDGESDIPMAILRDPWTGQVRGILRDPLRAGEVAADGAGVSIPDLEVLFSRGIPVAGSWRR